MEIGWCLSSSHSGKGLATEGAQAVLNYAFGALELPEIVSFAALHDEKSRRVKASCIVSAHSLDAFESKRCLI